ncbi:hypothetical protein SPFL3101_02361 [Sporomusaceae bacterium FL31]|nr:hypothetical protein SPFL3101_02361 [Sporomusaceae bacterium FL31]
MIFFYHNCLLLYIFVLIKLCLRYIINSSNKTIVCVNCNAIKLTLNTIQGDLQGCVFANCIILDQLAKILNINLLGGVSYG